MNKIRLRNYRSIEDSGVVNLAPLTIAVGRNSAGKSSFIRIFPLLKQTIEMKVSDPILWYGDYVDFGDYSHTVSNNKKDAPIEFNFELTLRDSRYPNYARYNGIVKELKVWLELSVREHYFDRIKIEFEDQIVVINCAEDGRCKIIINDEESIYENIDLVNGNRLSGEIIPQFYEVIKYENQLRLSRYYNNQIIERCIKYIYPESQQINQRYYYETLGIQLGSKQEILSQFQKINKNKFENKTLNHKMVIRYNNFVIASKLPDLINRINQSFVTDMRHTSYIKPIRARVDRYYRVQGISVKELDADGSNLPMILMNMSKKELASFESWCKSTFGIVFSVYSTEGHVSLIMKNDVDGEEITNVADTGYGYSQILPIVMLLWMIRNDYRPYRETIEKTVVIEQPELHLHPAYQAKMIDVFINIINEAKERGIDLKIIIETHSEVMINRLGGHVAYGHIKKEDINILVFNKGTSSTSVESKLFDDDGLLRGWPSDFFAPEDLR